ncbi:HlyD family secretion protein [Neorhizobium sp. JUb45]|uniref:HlyD family secretion protein n=1 Tax=Neorhizobium sp. JUb45 TaxID=2485113 RepID=UPI00104A7EFC|nr:HlyD family secretion protein [Neorhizobium sp. JUb45]TCQ99443.1 membrane fusion protein (multidrug efflux system) [Neorhizobium sp. JUb45]
MHQNTHTKPPAVVATGSAASDKGKPQREYVKFVVPTIVVVVVCALAGLSTQRWDKWTAGLNVQTTDNAYIKADLSHLSARTAGNVQSVHVSDFDYVKAGDIILEIDPSENRAKRDLALAGLQSAEAQLTNLDNQEVLQRAAIVQAEAQQRVAEANAALAKTEATRQTALMDKGAGVQQKREQADAQLLSSSATAGAAAAAVESSRAQLDYIGGQRQIFLADVAAARATLKSAELALSYTKIVAPVDGVVSERQVHVGDYVTAGTNTISIIPLPSLHILANFKETQLARMREGQEVAVEIDGIPDEAFTGKVTRISPAAGSQFALLPADNATGNFTKVVQRIPVRIDLKPTHELTRLRAGMSAVVSVTVADE